MALDADGLPEDAVEIAAKGICKGPHKTCSCHFSGHCHAQDMHGADALLAVAALRRVIRDGVKK